MFVFGRLRVCVVFVELYSVVVIVCVFVFASRPVCVLVYWCICWFCSCDVFVCISVYLCVSV